MNRMLIGAFVVSAAACSSIAPVKVESGEVCFRCRRVIADSRLAAETIDGAFVAKFKSSGCLAKYLAEHPEDTSIVFVTDYASGRLIRPVRARFVPTLNRDNGERDYVAFMDVASAEAEALSRRAKILTWEDVRAEGRDWADRQLRGN